MSKTLKVKIHPDSLVRHYSKRELAEWCVRLENENNRLEDLLSRVADVATGGKLSKTNYGLDTYSEAIHEHLCDERDEAFKEGQKAAENGGMQ